MSLIFVSKSLTLEIHTITLRIQGTFKVDQLIMVRVY